MIVGMLLSIVCVLVILFVCVVCDCFFGIMLELIEVLSVDFDMLFECVWFDFVIVVDVVGMCGIVIYWLLMEMLYLIMWFEFLVLDDFVLFDVIVWMLFVLLSVLNMICNCVDWVMCEVGLLYEISFEVSLIGLLFVVVMV